MAFSGKSTFSAGATLPEIVEDVSDLVSIVSPYETALLDALGDPHRVASSTRHEWMEDALLPNNDVLNEPAISDGAFNTVELTVGHAERFRVNDVIQAATLLEVMLVTGVNAGTSQITVARGYGGSVKQALSDGMELRILGSPSLEGEEAPTSRFTARQRLSNFTQIFAAGVQVSGSEAAVRQLAVQDELDYQKTNRLRELLRDLENSVLNGVAHDTTPQGSASVRRTMRGLLSTLESNRFAPGVGGFSTDSALTEAGLNLAMRRVWEQANSRVDLIVVGGAQKRRINGFVAESQRFRSDTDHFKSLISTYESDFGICRVVLSRHMPSDAVLLLDSSRVSVLPLMGRSFQYKALAVTGDYVNGELLGEYTLECRNEAAHGLIRGLDNT